MVAGGVGLWGRRFVEFDEFGEFGEFGELVESVRFVELLGWLGRGCWWGGAFRGCGSL